MSYKATCIVFLFIGLFFPSVIYPADANGYTAQYECKAGGANCNVDVATLTTTACDTTITTADSAATITTKMTDNRFVCVDKGDYTAKGTFTLPNSGTSGARKVLRYTRSGDTDDEPWNQSVANQALITKIDTNGQDYWIIHRLTIDRKSSGDGTLVALFDDTTNLIMNRILVQNGPNSGWLIATHNTGQQDIVLQNSVVRTASVDTVLENQCVGVGNTLRFWAVNNEIYDCNKAFTASDGDSFVGGVLENNDLYNSPARQTDCNGNLDTAPRNCGTMEGMAVFKGGATQASPGRVIHNRIWGGRIGDSNIALCCENVAISFSSSPAAGTGADYMLFQNNIIFDGHVGIWNYHGQDSVSPGNPADGPNNVSVIGNLLYNMYDRVGTAFDDGAFKIWRADEVEWYLNTIIDARDTWMIMSSGTGEASDNSDVRCNVIIDSAVADFSGSGTGLQKDYQVYYGTTHSSETNKIDKTLNTRANSTAYSLNDVIRTTASPPADGMAGDFLYKVVSAGTSAGAPPSYCTKLNCVTIDGTMAVKAIRGPYKFFKKLRTVSGGEETYIPYARAVNLSVLPEFGLCLDTFASRTGIGINNDDNIGSDDRL